MDMFYDRDFDPAHNSMRGHFYNNTPDKDFFIDMSGLDKSDIESYIAKYLGPLFLVFIYIH